MTVTGTLLSDFRSVEFWSMALNLCNVAAVAWLGWMGYRLTKEQAERGRLQNEQQAALNKQQNTLELHAEWESRAFRCYRDVVWEIARDGQLRGDSPVIQWLGGRHWGTRMTNPTDEPPRRERHAVLSLASYFVRL